MIMRKLSAVAFITCGLALSSYGFAAPDKVAYELQERCSTQSAATFKRDWAKNDTRVRANYTNHYNSKLNKCFYLEIATEYPAKKGDGISELRRLYDLNENNEYGVFYVNRLVTTPFACVVLGKQCSSESEWKLLIKPYMED